MSGDPKKRTLCNEGELADCSYLVSGSSVYSASACLPEVEYASQDEILVGALELFLVDGIAPPPRLTSVSVSLDAHVSKVSFEQVLKSAREYEYGIKANRFLAGLLDKTNDLVRAMFRAMPAEWLSYQERAILFYDLISRWEGVAARSGVQEYRGIVDEMKANALYLAGERFNQERVVSCIAFGSSWLKSSQRFPSEQAFCRAGDDADCMYVLLQGSVHVTKPNQILATICEQGECFGELGFLLRGKRTADLVATAGTALLKLDNATLPEFHSSHPDMFIQIAGTLAKRIHANLETLKRYNATSPEKAQSEARELNETSQRVVAAFLERLRRFLRIASNFEISELISHAQERLGKV